MTTLSLTLPISCQICLGKVKDPVICPNNHAFCTLCLDVWLQTNSCCPTCRVEITKEKPYRKVIGSTENNETISLQTRMQLRKTRLELLGREYETEIQNLNRQLNLVTEEIDKLKEELKSKEQATATPAGNPLLSDNIEAFSSLTKKLQEISTTYDDVRRDMTKLQQEKEKLQRENNDLKNEISRLKEDSTFTKSPKRYEKFTITGLKAKVEQYEKENQQLKKALQNSDKYVEQLQLELATLKKQSAKCLCKTEMNTQRDGEADEDRTEIDRQETVSNNMSARQLPSHDQFDATVVSITPLNHGNSSEFPSSAVPALTPSHQRESEQCRPVQDDSPTTSAEASGECSRDLFPATKKLLALKKIHETRNISSSPSSQNVRHDSPAPAIDLLWSSCVPCVNYDSSNDADEETTITSNKITSQQSSESLSCSFTEGTNHCSETGSNNVILTAAGPWAVPPSASSVAEPTNFGNSFQLSKRNASGEPFLLNKKIKVEKD